MKITANNIEISTYERRLMKRSSDFPEFSHNDIFDIGHMSQMAYEEEFEREIDFFDKQRGDLGDMKKAFSDVRYANFDTLRLGRFVRSVTDVAHWLAN